MSENRDILFFDGVCNLCNFFVDLVMRWDRKGVIHFAPLQGSTAQQRLPEHYTKGLYSVVFYRDGKAFDRSSAVFCVAWILGGPFLILVPFWIFPRFFTNWVYDFVARFRYSWFGKRSSCRVPTPEERARFLD